MFQPPVGSTHTSNRFFPALPPIADGHFEYNSAFAAFLKATNQKQQTAIMMGKLAAKLHQKKIAFERDKPMNVVDLGCANSTTGLGYLDRMDHPFGFNYIGFDINDQFIDEAKANLSKSPLIKTFNLIKSDVLSGHLSTHPSVRPHSIDLIFISHLAYYLKDESSGKHFVNDLLTLLNEQGMAIFLHEDSTFYFRSTYNKNYKNCSAPSLLKKSSQELVKTPAQFNELSFTSNLTFAVMTEELWDAAKNPALYKKFAHIPGFLDNLNKMAFIVQCDLSTLHHDGRLGHFINEIKSILEKNDYHFNLVTRMQLLVTPQNPHAEAIQMALNELQHDTGNLLPINTPQSAANESQITPAALCYS